MKTTYCLKIDNDTYYFDSFSELKTYCTNNDYKPVVEIMDIQKGVSLTIVTFRLVK
jgi:hypothetical protein